ncbi:hypothetical protein M378DRAFT_570334 [Amanita muscaria Koide BX008]|uniref:Uncharacterized protein n=1 Tax=Amanita muscaria (strain Koide BX008) TaxID=946122 RepID=A0A0C2WHW9_AMAMK|nr:hypothetical protein M378DRAFT_570334 [Amanita muscaria Koide BX008]
MPHLLHQTTSNAFNMNYSRCKNVLRSTHGPGQDRKRLGTIPISKRRRDKKCRGATHSSRYNSLKLVPGRLPMRWPDWIMACVTMFSGLGSPTESVHDFLAIVAEEVGSADLLGLSNLQIQQTLSDSIPMVTHAINTTLESLPVSTALEIQSAIKCFQAWITLLPTK